MHLPLAVAATGLFTTASAAAIPSQQHKRSESIPITPNDAFASSLGVLGCKINTNRVAYWPTPVGCDDMCVKVSREGRSVHLLKIDQSRGAYDISYGMFLQFPDSARRYSFNLHDQHIPHKYSH
jgi:hypothetical protein